MNSLTHHGKGRLGSSLDGKNYRRTKQRDSRAMWDMSALENLMNSHL